MALRNAEHSLTRLHVSQCPPLHRGCEICQRRATLGPSLESFTTKGVLLFTSFQDCRQLAPLLGHPKSPPSSQDSLAVNRMSPSSSLGPSTASLLSGFPLASMGHPARSPLLMLWSVRAVGPMTLEFTCLVGTQPRRVEGPSEPS